MGNVILKNVLKPDAPSNSEAFSSVSGIDDSADVIRENATGKFRYTWARIMALKE